MICWDEPDKNGLSIACAVSREEAIARQKTAAAKRGYIYETDVEALADFMTVNWAWEKDDDA